MYLILLSCLERGVCFFGFHFQPYVKTEYSSQSFQALAICLSFLFPLHFQGYL